MTNDIFSIDKARDNPIEFRPTANDDEWQRCGLRSCVKHVGGDTDGDVWYVVCDDAGELQTVHPLNIRNIAQPEPDAAEHVVAVQLHRIKNAVTVYANCYAFDERLYDARNEVWQVADTLEIMVLRTELTFAAGRVVSQDGVELIPRPPKADDVTCYCKQCEQYAAQRDTAQRELAEANQRCADQATTIGGMRDELHSVVDEALVIDGCPDMAYTAGGQAVPTEPQPHQLVEYAIKTLRKQLADAHRKLAVMTGHRDAAMAGLATMTHQCENQANTVQGYQRIIDDMKQPTSDEPDGGDTITLTEAGELAIASEHAIEQAKSDGRAEVLALWERASRAGVTVMGLPWSIGQYTGKTAIFRDECGSWDNGEPQYWRSFNAAWHALPAALDALEGGG